ncbi:NAD(P)-binding protein [Mycena crocata]|nr:NAD(P)-binding protein [Mycena crocata]
MPSRVWFITGASSGFGSLLAQKALSKGEKVVATLRKPQAISDWAAEYNKEQLLVLKVDVSKEEDVTAAFVAAKNTFGRIDVVFNNAGYAVLGEVEGTSEEVARPLFEVNFWGAVNVAKQAISFFRDVNSPSGGILLNVSSMFGVYSPPAAGFYAASKFALEAVIDALAKELDPAWNIKVCLFCPGWFKTDMMTGANAVVTDVHPAYRENDSLSSIQTRSQAEGLARGDSSLLGDANKLVNKFYQISQLEDPPYRVAFGEDAKQCFHAKSMELKSNLENGEEWSKDLTYV